MKVWLHGLTVRAVTIALCRYRAIKAEHAKEMERMKSEFETRIEEIEQEHSSRVKQLIKEFNSKISEKDREFQETFGEAVGLYNFIVSQNKYRQANNYNVLGGHQCLEDQLGA